MSAVFYIASTIAVVTAFLAVTRSNALHAVLWLLVALFGIAVDFLVLGAPFLAALEVIVYAGAIVVVILFVMMMVAGPAASRGQERRWLPPRAWILPSLLAAGLAALISTWLAGGAGGPATAGTVIGARRVGMLLFSDWLVAVELASILLLAGLVGALYLSSRSEGPARTNGRRPQSGRRPWPEADDTGPGPRGAAG
jgi:NADH-quinone oxidoreductase subunit J